MFYKSIIASSIAIAMITPAMAEGFIRDLTMSGTLKNETALFTQSGTTIGAGSSHHGGDILKSETSARLFINGTIGEESAIHAELRPVLDSEGVKGDNGDSYSFHQSYTQRDYFRELYVDTYSDDWSFRIGKQQVVWGTADGIKLLDIINPTDFTEMAQNVMDESRIPVWMVTAERDLASGANIQVVLSQPRENIFAGLDRNIRTTVRANSPAGADLTTGIGHMQGHPFMLLGVDSITGKFNGFLNIVPDLGSISAGFANQFTPAGLQASTGMTVAFFAAQNAVFVAGLGIPGGGDGAQTLAGFAANYDTNLSNGTSAADWGVVQDSAFEYMGNATFATFDAFAFAQSQYVYDMPKDYEANIAFRYKNTLDNGLTYSLNYSYNYDKNPIINISWRNDAGELLTQNYGVNNTISLTDSALNAYGAVATAGADGTLGTGDDVAGRIATLRFEQTVERAHNIGTALDYGMDTETFGPIVLRGEFLYQNDVYSPVMNLTALGIGDLPNGLTMVKGDRFKYVLGVDITAMTNMLVSAQFIQDINLDYIDTGARYTADFSTMHLTNGFNKAEEFKEFYSLFLSKPFGAEQQHRWNNIFMYEENGGNWNRFDIEYSFDDNLIGMFEYNAYWGERNTQFGQLEDSSNVQLGIKYLFEDY